MEMNKTHTSPSKNRSIRKILIANRGEIACRIIRTARQMGISTVAVYSEADADALHVEQANEAVLIGPSAPRESYLSIDKVIAAAKSTGADAIHPGYGFLSENGQFCESCKENDLVFIGPSSHAINTMGSKSAAKELMAKADVPLIPGYHGEEQSPGHLKGHAQQTGYPVLLKASAGGGGKGMRVVWDEDEFDEALDAAKRESIASFNDDKMLIEKYLQQPRHIEIQIFCDSHGNGVYLFERDCSIQRRHQKVIEESPAPGMTEQLRSDMGNAALRAAQAIDYEGAGTVEFLLDSDDAYYFMEMNTRLQVEHPVTEMITGQDLVEWQIRVASGETLPKSQSELKISGHAFEARIYAEDPDNDFLPASGIIDYLDTPRPGQNVRIDTGIKQGDEVSVFYDPMIAKLIVWDEDRNKALKRLGTSLQQFRIAGINTNINFLFQLAKHSAFQAADIDTEFIEKHADSIFISNTLNSEDYLPLMCLYLVLEQQNSLVKSALSSHEPDSPWSNGNGWRMNQANTQKIKLEVSGHSYVIDVEIQRGNQTGIALEVNKTTIHASGTLDGESLLANVNGQNKKVIVTGQGHPFTLFLDHLLLAFRNTALLSSGEEDIAENHGLTAPMNGTVVTLLVKPGDEVKKDDALLVMEAMKMEHTIRAPANGKVAEFFYQAGDLIDGGSELLHFEDNPEPGN